MPSPRNYSPASGPTGYRFPMVVEGTGERVMIVRKHLGNQLSKAIAYEAEDGRLFGPSQRLGHLVPFESELDAVPVEDEPFERGDTPGEHEFF